jgi:hypothetical protein
MTTYLVLIWGDQQAWSTMDAQERRRIEDGHAAFNATAGSAVLRGYELQPSSAARTVRSDRDGRKTVTDGPFLETKEIIGGFYLLEAADLEQAIELAGLLPEVGAAHSGVEVRPVMSA